MKILNKLIKINDNFYLIQILGNKFENKEYAPINKSRYWI